MTWCYRFSSEITLHMISGFNLGHALENMKRVDTFSCAYFIRRPSMKRAILVASFQTRCSRSLNCPDVLLSLDYKFVPFRGQ